jgi:glycosyltransferase involved in cell wall biosynthesis
MESSHFAPHPATKLRVAMVVIDANEVAGEVFRAKGARSPAVHPAVQTLIDALGRREDLDLEVVCASARVSKNLSEKRGGVTYTIVAAPRGISGTGMGLLLRLASLVWYLRSSNHDLVHGQGTEREAALAAVFCGRPSLITLHGNFREISRLFQAKPLSYLWCAACLESLALHLCKGIICISRYVEGITACFGKPQFLIPNPADKKFLIHERPSHAGRPRVICLGTIDARKRTRFILDACRLLWAAGMDFEFHVYGGIKWATPYCTAFLEELEPWEKLGFAFFKGFTANPEAVISESDIMVTASCEESFGMNVLEAMACGVPVVATPVGGIPDILGTSGEAGLFFEQDSVNDCAQAISRLICDPELRRRMGIAGRKRAANLFSAEKVASMTMSAYHQVLNGAPAQSKRIS